MAASLSIGLLDTFAETLAVKVSTPGVRPVDAVEQLLTETFIQNLTTSPDLQLLEAPAIKLHAMYYADRGATLARLAIDGYATWHVELAFSTALENALDDLNVVAVGLELRPISYGFESRAHRFSTKRLKSQANHVIRLNHVVIPPAVFANTLHCLGAMPALEQPYVANPRPGPRSQGYSHGIQGFEFVSFDHVAPGDRHLCSCARPAIEKMTAAARGMAGTYSVVRGRIS
ncbi:hypothetical protein [Rhizobium sp. 18055]|uniref:hypothetical protein n=1 Tax=Rhizobium sp. 18055 TaxID=2681403 RepID=UPI00135AE9B0|nr:hypothetical protein [Rhizobium sp. 18055]